MIKSSYKHFTKYFISAPIKWSTLYVLLPNYMHYLESFHLYLAISGNTSWWDPRIPRGSVDGVQHLSDLGQSCALTFCHIHVLSSGQDHKCGHWRTTTALLMVCISPLQDLWCSYFNDEYRRLPPAGMESYFFSFRRTMCLIGNIKDSPASNSHCCVGLVRILKEYMGNALMAPLSHNIYNLQTAYLSAL